MSQLYWDAALVLSQVISKRKSLKTASFSLKKNGKMIHELVRKVLPHYRRLSKDVKILHTKNPNQAILMLYDYYTKGRISGGGGLKKQIVENFLPNQIQESSSTQPKIWVRLNNFHPSSPPFEQDPASQSKDEIVPNLYFVTKTPQITQMIQQGHLIAQSKASCLPVSCLNLPKGNYNALDTCSAPGNKTIQLAEYLKSKSSGKVFAFERDPRRFEVLQKRLKICRVDNVEAANLDFFDVKRLQNVKVAVVDPSCSGSGIIEHQMVDHGKLQFNFDYVDDRVENLALFQEKILEKTLNVPGIRQVVYSTCSIYRRENEQVVENVMGKFWRRFRIENVIREWKIRGLGDFGKFMVRCIPNKEDSQGFFVAKFVKRDLRLRHRMIKRRKIFWHYKKRLRFF